MIRWKPGRDGSEGRGSVRKGAPSLLTQIHELTCKREPARGIIFYELITKQKNAIAYLIPTVLLGYSYNELVCVYSFLLLCSV